MLSKQTIIVTGAAGFIANTLSYKLIGNVKKLICLDNFNDYYDPELKKSRKLRLDKKAIDLKLDESRYEFIKVDLREESKIDNLITKYRPDTICHLAAQAGVRYSLKYPHSYVDNNISATINLLESARKNSVTDFIFASTSSVYGLSKDMPFSEEAPIDTPISTYSTTKRACELLCHTYNNLYGIRFRILRFFTVYGPWGRPDMALFLFTKAILEGKSIDVFNHGRMQRDFTFVDDIVDGFILAIKSKFDFEIFNLGCGDPIELMHFIQILEKELGIEANKNMHPIQLGDVPATWADISKAGKMLGYKPKISVHEGINHFVSWYRGYYNL